ncbi:hypothetical protein MCO_01828, partial [Bartonella sp. DB5-6]
MKKVYAKLAGGKKSFLRPFYKASFVKMLSLSSIVALLSGVSPVYSKRVASKEIANQVTNSLTKEAFLISAKSPAVAFPQRVISVYDYYNDDTSDQENYVTALKVGSVPAANAVSDYANFLTTTFSGKSSDIAIVNILKAYDNNISKNKRNVEEQYKRSLTGQQFPILDNSTSQRLAQDGSDVTVIEKFGIQRNTSIQPRGVNYNVTIGDSLLYNGIFGVVIGYGAEAAGDSTVVIGSSKEGGSVARAKGDYTTAVGSLSRALEEGATALGHRAYAHKEDSVSIGFYSQANVYKGVALGSRSIADTAAGSVGYNPLTNAVAGDSGYVWKSTYGAVSVGDVAKSKSRQIVGVAAGTADTDAVNIAQLKELRTFAAKGWKISVNNKNATVVSIDDTVDFSAGSSNFTITKGNKNNNMKFDLAKDLVLVSVKAGSGTLDATGLVIKDGPKILTTGIEAGNKKITGVAKGTGANDAVNFSQLEEIKEQVASSSFVKQDAETKHITIGKEAEGDKIDIVNNKGEKRVISGIANGAISDVSTEAMTGYQLHQLGSNIAGYLGGGASFNGGTWTPPSFKVKTA